MDRARLIYRLVMKMDMDVGSMISLQITQIAQSSTSRLGFPTLITALYDAQGVDSDTFTFEYLSPVTNLAYIKENCWNPTDPSIVFPGPRQVQTRATPDAPSAPPTMIHPPVASSSIGQPFLLLSQSSSSPCDKVSTMVSTSWCRAFTSYPFSSQWWYQRHSYLRLFGQESNFLL